MKINDYSEYYYGKGLVNAYWAVNAVEDIRLIQGASGEDSKITAAVEYHNASTRDADAHGQSGSCVRISLIAWVDVNKNDLVDAGDYLSETPVIGVRLRTGLELVGQLSEEFYPD